MAKRGLNMRFTVVLKCVCINLQPNSYLCPTSDLNEQKSPTTPPPPQVSLCLRCLSGVTWHPSGNNRLVKQATHPKACPAFWAPTCSSISGCAGPGSSICECDCKVKCSLPNYWEICTLRRWWVVMKKCLSYEDYVVFHQMVNRETQWKKHIIWFNPQRCCFLFPFSPNCNIINCDAI